MPPKFQGVPRSLDDGVQAFNRVYRGGHLRISGCMNYVVERSVREAKGSRVAGMKNNRPVRREMGGSSLEGCRVPRQDRGGSLQVELIVGPEKTFQKPTSEEPRTAGQEDPLPANLFPQTAGVIEDMVQIVG